MMHLVRLYLMCFDIMEKEEINTYYPKLSILTGKGEGKNIQSNVTLQDKIQAPINAGDRLGEIIYTLNGNEVGRVNIFAGESVERLSYVDLVLKIAKKMLLL